jgi:hypothetical protein
MHQSGFQECQTGVTTGNRLCSGDVPFIISKPSCTALSASTCFAARLLVLEALLSALQTGLLGNAVCKADEVVEVDLAVAEESFVQHNWVPETYVGSIQDCALLCKNNDVEDGLYCIGFRFETVSHGDAGLQGCLLLFEDNGFMNILARNRHKILRSSTALQAVYEKSEFFEVICVMDD